MSWSPHFRSVLPKNDCVGILPKKAQKKQAI